jgi:hypothetical protein
LARFVQALQAAHQQGWNESSHGHEALRQTSPGGGLDNRSRLFSGERGIIMESGGLLLGILLFLYFIPAIIASSRNHHQYGAIFALNLFLRSDRRGRQQFGGSDSRPSH